MLIFSLLIRNIVIVLSIYEDKYKTLICCTGFPTLGFSGDNFPKITVFIWLFQDADILTKALTRRKFEYHRDRTGVKDNPFLVEREC